MIPKDISFLIYGGTLMIGIALIVLPSVSLAFSLYLSIGSSIHIRSCNRGVYREPQYIFIWPKLVWYSILAKFKIHRSHSNKS